MTSVLGRDGVAGGLDRRDQQNHGEGGDEEQVGDETDEEPAEQSPGN